MPHKRRIASHASRHSSPQLQNIRHVSVDQESVRSSGGSKAKTRRKRHSAEFISFHSIPKVLLMIFVYNADVLFENFWHLQDYCTLLAGKPRHPADKATLRMSLVHRSKNEGKKKILRKKREKESLLSGCSVFTPIWRVFLCGSPRVYIPIPLPHVPLRIPSAGSHPSDVILLISLPMCSCGSTRAAQMINHPIGFQDGPRTLTPQASCPLSLFFSPWEYKEAPQTCRNKVQLIYYCLARGTRAVTNNPLLRGLCTVAREWAEYLDLGQTLENSFIYQRIHRAWHVWQIRLIDIG